MKSGARRPNLFDILSGEDQNAKTVLEKAIVIAMVWMFAMGCSILAMILGVRCAGRFVSAIVGLAVASILIGAMGFQSWTPFGYLPEIGWSITNGESAFSVRSGWLFIAPLVLGIIVLGCAARNRIGKD